MRPAGEAPRLPYCAAQPLWRPPTASLYPLAPCLAAPHSFFPRDSCLPTLQAAGGWPAINVTSEVGMGGGDPAAVELLRGPRGKRLRGRYGTLDASGALAPSVQPWQIRQTDPMSRALLLPLLLCLGWPWSGHGMQPGPILENGACSISHATVFCARAAVQGMGLGRAPGAACPS